MKQLLLDALSPILAVFLSVALPALVTLAFARFQKWTGIEIEARQREALQSALANAARIVIAGATKQAGIAYVLASVPGALKGLKVSGDDRVSELLEPHITAQTAILRSLVSSNPIRADPK